MNKLITNRARILTILKKNKRTGITKELCADLRLGYGLGNHIMILKEQGNNITTSMERNRTTGSIFARYLLK